MRRTFRIIARIFANPLLILAALFIFAYLPGLVSVSEAQAAVAHDNATESHTGTTGSTNQASFSWSHAGAASGVKGILVFVFNANNTGDDSTSVTYGGTCGSPTVSLSTNSSWVAKDTVTEPGTTRVWFLGSGVPQGTQTVCVNRNNNANTMYAVAITVTGAGDTEIYTPGVVLLQENGTWAEQNVNDGSPGTNSVRYAGDYTGSASPNPAGTNSTALQSIDFGAFAVATVRETTAGQGSRPVGFSNATADDRATVHLAVREITVSGNVYSDEASTALSNCDGSTQNVKLVIATSTPGQYTTSCTSGTGAYSFSMPSPPPAGTVMNVYIKGVASTFGSTVTRYSGSGSVLNLMLRKDRVIVQHEDAGPITNSDLNNWDKDNDTDVPYVVSGTQPGLTVDAGRKLIVNNNKTYQPLTGAASTTPSTAASPAGDVQINSGATLNLATTSLTVGGDLMNFGTILASTTGAVIQSTTFNGQRTTGNGFKPGNNFIFGNLTIAGTVGITASSSFIASSTFTVNSGSIDLSAVNATSTGDATIASGASLGAPGSTKSFYIGGSFTNSGTFVANGGKVFFNSTGTNSISGNFGSANSFNKVDFDGGGSWTVRGPMFVAAGGAGDVYVIHNGTVTQGDSNGDDLTVLGNMRIASTTNETGTFQTLALAQGSTITIDINQNNGGSPPGCTTCIVTVGALSGTGQGNFKIAANTILRLNASTAADVGIEVESTGYLQIQGALSTSGTIQSLSQDTASTTILVSGSPFSAGQFNGMHLEITNPSSGALSQFYDINNTYANGIVISATSTGTTTVSGIGGSGSCSGSAICTFNIASTTIITANQNQTSRYVHNLNADKYYLIASTTNAATDVIRIVSNLPDDFATLSNGHVIEITDGIRAGDTFNVIDFATVTATTTACTSKTTSEVANGYIWTKAGSETVIRYADICNLGRNATNKSGLEFRNVTGDNANEGVTVEYNRINRNYYGLFPANSTALNTVEGFRYNLITDSASQGFLNDTGDYYDVAFNRMQRSGGHGMIFQNGANNHTIRSNISLKNTQCGVFIDNSYGNQAYSNTLAYNGCAQANLVLNNAKGNTLGGTISYGFMQQGFGALFTGASANNTLASSTIFQNAKSGFVADTSATNTVAYLNKSFSNGFHGMTNICSSANLSAPVYLFNNNFYSNDQGGLFEENIGDCDVIGINEQYGVLGTNGVRLPTSDVTFTSAGAAYPGFNKLRLYNSTLASTNPPSNMPADLGAADYYSFNGKEYWAISRKHNGSTGSTTVWGFYRTPSDNTETPQDESTDRFNYANNLWEKSASPHFYVGTGSEDTNLNYDLTTADLSAGPYVYRMTATSSGVCSGRGFKVYRNDAYIGDAYCGVQFTGDTGVGVKFKIDGGTPANYATFDNYQFIVWDAANNTNVQKKIDLKLAVDNYSDSYGTTTYTVPVGGSLQLLGQAAGTNVTQVTAASSTRGYQFNVAGTINADAYSFNYGGGNRERGALSLMSGATVTSLSNGAFDNYAFNNGASSTFIEVNSSLIGAGTPSKTFTGMSFTNTTGFATCNVNATSTAASGYWEFSSSGAFAGESYDCANGLADPTPGQLNWTIASTPATITSAANQVFAINQATTSISQITVTSGAGTGAVTVANGLRIAIATSTNLSPAPPTLVKMHWDYNDTTATIGGTPQTCTVGTGVSYEGSDKSVLVVPISGSDCASGDNITISGLSFAGFDTVNASATALYLLLDGATDQTANASNTAQYAVIKGKDTLSDQTAGQEANKLNITQSSASNVELFAFKLTPAGESVNVTQLVVQIPDVNGFSCGNITTNMGLYADYNANGNVDAGETTVGGTPACSINASTHTGTLTFSTAFATSTARGYILRSDVASNNAGNKLTFSISSSDITAAGVVSLQTITPSGTVSQALQFRESNLIGGGSTGAAPVYETPTGGGTQQGGGGGTGSGGGSEPPTGGGTQQGGGGGSVKGPDSRFFAGVGFAVSELFRKLISALGQ